MHIKQDTGLSYFCGVSLYWGAALIDDFQLLPNNRGLQDTIHFKDEGHRCSILKGWVTPFTYFFRNILRDFLELPQLGNHIQLMEIPILSIFWMSDYPLTPPPKKKILICEYNAYIFLVKEPCHLHFIFCRLCILSSCIALVLYFVILHFVFFVYCHLSSSISCLICILLNYYSAIQYFLNLVLSLLFEVGKNSEVFNLHK